jgi:hypothetical protein
LKGLENGPSWCTGGRRWGRRSPRRLHRCRGAAAIERITCGNYRLAQRLFSQIARVLAIIRLRTITKEVAETARESLVIRTKVRDSL